jgi:cardiolipin synthase
MIEQAVDYIYFSTPYLILTEEMSHALSLAARRGVDVRIITPGIPDKKIIKIMTDSSYPYLLKSGVKIYEYTPGFIHEKTLVADDKYAVVGTINFDYRSFNHNFENAVWMYATPTVDTIKEEVLLILKKCERVDEKKCKLTFREWVIRNGIRLFAPLL